MTIAKSNPFQTVTGTVVADQVAGATTVDVQLSSADATALGVETLRRVSVPSVPGLAFLARQGMAVTVRVGGGNLAGQIEGWTMVPQASAAATDVLALSSREANNTGITFRIVRDAGGDYVEVYDEATNAQIVRFGLATGLVLTGDLDVTGDSEFTGDVDVTGDVAVTGDSEFTGDVEVIGSTLSDTYLRTTFAFAVADVLDDTADEWLGTGGGAGVVLTIPDSATMPGRRVTVKKVDAGAGAVTLDFTPPETCDGVAPWILANQFESVTIESDGADWHVVQAYPAATVLRDIVPTTPVGYPYAVLPADQTIFAVEHVGAGDNEIDLPAATGSGRKITVVCIGVDGAGTLLIDPAGAEQINALGAGVVFAELDTLMDSVTLMDYAAGQWFVVSRSIA